MSKIESTDTTWNPVTGCTKVSPGCYHCYAERMAKRLRGRCGYPADDPFKVTLHYDRLEDPYSWRKPRKVFVCSMGDLFHPDVPLFFIAVVFETMRENRMHNFQVLTKRPERLQEFVRMYKDHFSVDLSIIKNIWLGVSCETQVEANIRIPYLLHTPAAVRFVSLEPLIDEIDLGWFIGSEPQASLDWVIVGGESGPRARPMYPRWARKLRDQCVGGGIPFFFKQWGEWAEVGTDVDRKGNAVRHEYAFPDHGEWHLEDGTILGKVGKRIAGRFLDRKIWDEYPQVE